MDDNDKYRNAHYPDLHPCVDGCKYWRSIYTAAHATNSTMMCHYNVDNNELRGDYPDLIRGTCSKFATGKSSGKRTQPYARIRKRG